MKTTLRTIGLGLLMISGLIGVITSSVWLPKIEIETLRAAVAIAIIALIMIFGPMALSLSIIYKNREQERKNASRKESN